VGINNFLDGVQGWDAGNDLGDVDLDLQGAVAAGAPQLFPYRVGAVDFVPGGGYATETAADGMMRQIINNMVKERAGDVMRRWMERIDARMMAACDLAAPLPRGPRDTLYVIVLRYMHVYANKLLKARYPAANWQEFPGPPRVKQYERQSTRGMMLGASLDMMHAVCTEPTFANAAALSP
jgi:hypothetical protein